MIDTHFLFTAFPESNEIAIYIIFKILGRKHTIMVLQAGFKSQYVMHHTKVASD